MRTPVEKLEQWNCIITMHLFQICHFTLIATKYIGYYFSNGCFVQYGIVCIIDSLLCGLM